MSVRTVLKRPWCRFAVLETKNPLGAYSDKLEQRFGDGQQSEPGGAA